MTYHKTLAHEDETLRTYRKRAQTQEEKEPAHIKGLPFGTGVTGSYIWNQVFQRRCPLTSPRRVLSDLKSAGILVKTSEKWIGEFKDLESVYKLAGPVQKDLLL